MKIILAGRGGGKTYQLLRLSEETGAVIVTLHDPEQVQRQAEELGLKIPRPITYHQLLHGQFHQNRGMLFDDVDEFMCNLARDQPVVAIALTSDRNDWVNPFLKQSDTSAS